MVTSADEAPPPRDRDRLVKTSAQPGVVMTTMVVCRQTASSSGHRRRVQPCAATVFTTYNNSYELMVLSIPRC
jgi:hypothetical protein